MNVNVQKTRLCCHRRCGNKQAPMSLPSKDWSADVVFYVLLGCGGCGGDRLACGCCGRWDDRTASAGTLAKAAGG